MEIKYMDLVKESWAFVKSDLGFFVIGLILVSMAGSCTGNIITPALYVGYIMAIMKKMKGESVSYGDIFNMGFSKFVPAFVTALIMGVAMSIGSVLLVVPGIIAGCTMMMAMFIIADEDNIAFMDAIKQGFELFKANWKVIILGSIVASFFGSLGGIACGVGVVVTMPITWVMMLKIYQIVRYQNGAAAPAAAPAADAAAPAAEA